MLETGTEYPPKEPRIEESSYEIATVEARILLTEPQEIMTVDQRRKEVENLLTIVPKLNKADSDGQIEAVEIMTRLLRSDQLSDQQAGAIARFLNHSFYVRDLRSELYFSPEEEREILVGDWDTINRVMTNNTNREAVWMDFKKNIQKSNKKITVFRGMYLNSQEAKIIKQSGLTPEGLRRHKTLENLLQQNLIANLKGQDPSFGYLKLLEERLLFSKVNVLLALWQMGGLGMANPNKLAISATTPEHAQRKRGKFWGNHILEIKIPANRAIVGPNTSDKVGQEDELSVLYYVSSNQIIGIYDTKKPDYDSFILTRFNKARRKISF